MASTRASRFAANVVLARLLAVEVFGLIAMAHAAVLLLSALREAGLGQAYVQRKYREDEGPRESVDTLFGGILSLNCVLFAAMLAVAPAVASFFAEDTTDVLPLVRVLAGLFLFDTFVSTPQFVLQRRMEFDKIARSELAGALTHAVLAIVAAFAGAGVWALVIGMLGERLVLATTLSVGARWRPGFSGSLRMARELLHFGKYLWGYALVASIGSVMDRVVIGKVHGAAGLGGYSQAFNLCILPATVISQLVNRVALPAMSRMQGDIPRLRAAFIKGLEHVAFLALPIGLGLLAVSDIFVPVVYGEKWRSIVPIVQVLAAYGTVLALASVCGPVLQALGKPQVFLYTELVRQGLLVVLLILLASRGEVAVAWCVLSVMVLASIIAFTVIQRLLDLRVTELLSPLARSLSGAAGMCLAVFGARHLVAPHVGESVELAVAIATGVLSYPLLSSLTNLQMVRDFARTLNEVRTSRSAKD